MPAPVASIPARYAARVARARVAALRIPGPDGPVGGPSDVAVTVRDLGALQAQEWGSGVWSVGLRSGRTLAEVENAIATAQIVRTWPMRGTLHFVAAEDARWMCRLLAPRHETALRARYAQLELTERVVGRARELVVEALTGAGPRSRPELFALLEAAGVRTEGQRGVHLLGQFCMEGLLCQGPQQGKQPTFVVLDEWVGFSRNPDRERALSLLAERYVGSHGPVTERDFAGWLGRPLGFAREALALLPDRLVRERVGDVELLMLADAPEAVGAAHLQLLPTWDEYLLGYKDRAAMVGPGAAGFGPGANGSFRPTLVVGGQVAGFWRRAISAREVQVQVEPFGPPRPRMLAAVQRAGAAYGRFLGLPARVRVGELAPGGSAPASSSRPLEHLR